MSRVTHLTRALVLGLACAAAPAWAAVELRVEARPPSTPIQVFATVTDANGDPVPGLTASSFESITIDDFPVLIQDGNLTLPPSQDDGQKVSVVLAMDHSSSVLNVAQAAMQAAVLDFIANMNDGDHAAIVKFNATNPAGASVVAAFEEIDTANGNPNLADAVVDPYPGDNTNLLDAIEVSVNHVLAPPVPLPAGPKAVIVITDGGENSSDISQSDVIALANANSIPIFLIGVGDVTIPRRVQLLTALASETGGAYFPAPDDQTIAEAYVTISTRLQNEYLLTFDDPLGISDCAEHELEVTVTGQAPASVLFTRRTCDTTPNPFSFPSVTNVEPGSTVVSAPVTITGIEVPAHISVIPDTYSIGCTGTFTHDPGQIENGQTVCIGHTASGKFSTSKTTTLTIGGVAGTFTSTTEARNGGGGGGGGGGASGLLELLLLAFGAALMGRRRTA